MEKTGRLLFFGGCLSLGGKKHKRGAWSLSEGRGRRRDRFRIRGNVKESDRWHQPAEEEGLYGRARASSRGKRTGLVDTGGEDFEREKTQEKGKDRQAAETMPRERGGRRFEFKSLRKKEGGPGEEKDRNITTQIREKVRRGISSTRVKDKSAMERINGKKEGLVNERRWPRGVR